MWGRRDGLTGLSDRRWWHAMRTRRPLASGTPAPDVAPHLDPPFASGPATAPSAADLVRAQPLRPVIVAGGLSLVLFALSAAFAIVIVWPIVPHERVIPPAVAGGAFILGWGGLVARMLVRPPTPDETVRFWGPAAKGLVIGSHLMCVWLIWGLMVHVPAARTDAQFVLASFLIAYIPVQIICSPENTLLIRFGIFAVLGSTVVYLFTRGTQEAALLAVYVTGFGAVMFFLSDVVRRTVKTTVEERLASEAAAKTLERLLAAVAQERDAKTRFISAASHDLGQPLQAASLFFDQTMRAADEAQRMRAADGVRRAFAAAEQLLSHMLNHLRLEADAVEPYPSRVALGPFLAQLAAQYAAAAAEAGVTVRCVRSRQVILVDPVLLGRAVGNLLANAIQHSAGSRVLLGVRCHGEKRLRIWIVDDGDGVPRSDARHIFDDYYRGMASRAAVRSGFGLGLSSVRRIAALMGGEAGLEPRWLGGAAFYLETPAASVRRLAPVLAGHGIDAPGAHEPAVQAPAFAAPVFAASGVETARS